MDQLIVRSTSGEYEEIVTGIDYSSFAYNYEQNSTREVTFTVYKIPGNEFVYSLISNEASILYHGQEYVIKTSTEIQSGFLYSKQVTAHHVYLSFQDHAIETAKDDKKWKLQDALDFVAKDNGLGYVVDCAGDWSKTTKTVDSLGNQTGSDALNSIAEAFSAIIFADNRHITLYDKATFYQNVDKTFRYLHNTEDVTVETDTTDLKTRVKVYGTKKSKKEINYLKIKTSELTLAGTWVKTSTYNTKSSGATASFTIDVKGDNDALEFASRLDLDGGTWSFYIDGAHVTDVVQYTSDKVTTKTFTISDKLTKGSHTVKMVFVSSFGTDAKPPKSYQPHGYLGTKSQQLFTVVANTDGDNAYNGTYVYVSPEEKSYQHPYELAPIKLTKSETQAEMITTAKAKLKDKPTVTLTLTYKGHEAISEREQWVFFHETMGFNTDVQLITLTLHHPFYWQPATVGFSNDTNNMVKIQQQWLRQLRTQQNQLATQSINLQNALDEADESTHQIIDSMADDNLAADEAETTTKSK